MKIQTSTVSNLKAVSNLTADFKGCTALVTGRNNSGKTSFLWALAQRIQGTKPDMILKRDEKEGFAEYTLTTGDKFRWEFKEGGKEKLTYITKDGIKAPATRAICDRFFPATFNVDEFLAAQPAKQRKTLQDLAGLDFIDIDNRFDIAYKERTAANTRASDAKVLFENTVMPPVAEHIDLQTLNTEKENVRKELNDLYLKNKQHNDGLRKTYSDAENKYRHDTQNFWNEQANIEMNLNDCKGAADVLINAGFRSIDLTKFIESLPQPSGNCTIPEPVEPAYIQELPDNAPLIAVEEKISKALEQNKAADIYTAWVDLKTKRDTAADLAVKANEAVQVIEKERMDLIKSANMPEGFTFTSDGIAYNGLSFTREQLSSSGIYIAALKLASMKIGEVRTLHFDASFLDKNSLAEIEQWATSQDLQLLIERPDFEAGEIAYEIIQN